MEIAKRLNAIIAQLLPFLSQEHQQQVVTAVERAKQVSMTELNVMIGVSFHCNFISFFVLLAARAKHLKCFSGSIVVTVAKPQLLSSQVPPFFFLFHYYNFAKACA